MFLDEINQPRQIRPLPELARFTILKRRQPPSSGPFCPCTAPHPVAFLRRPGRRGAPDNSASGGASLSGEAAGLQIRLGPSGGPGWVRLPRPSANDLRLIETPAQPIENNQDHAYRPHPPQELAELPQRRCRAGRNHVPDRPECLRQIQFPGRVSLLAYCGGQLRRGHAKGGRGAGCGSRSCAVSRRGKTPRCGSRSSFPGARQKTSAVFGFMCSDSRARAQDDSARWSMRSGSNATASVS